MELTYFREIKLYFHGILKLGTGTCAHCALKFFESKIIKNLFTQIKFYFLGILKLGTETCAHYALEFFESRIFRNNFTQILQILLTADYCTNNLFCMDFITIYFLDPPPEPTTYHPNFYTKLWK